MDLNAPWHPLGRRGTFSAAKVAALRRILADLDGIIRWGGDYAGRADEMHLEVVASALRVAAVAARILSGAITTHTPVPAPAPLPAPLTRKDRPMRHYVDNNGQHWTATDFNLQKVEPEYVDTATVDAGKAEPVTAEFITRLDAITRTNAEQALANGGEWFRTTVHAAVRYELDQASHTGT